MVNEKKELVYNVTIGKNNQTKLRFVNFVAGLVLFSIVLYFVFAIAKPISVESFSDDSSLANMSKTLKNNLKPKIDRFKSSMDKDVSKLLKISSHHKEAFANNIEGFKSSMEAFKSDLQTRESRIEELANNADDPISYAELKNSIIDEINKIDVKDEQFTVEYPSKTTNIFGLGDDDTDATKEQKFPTTLDEAAQLLIKNQSVIHPSDLSNKFFFDRIRSQQMISDHRLVTRLEQRKVEDDIRQKWLGIDGLNIVHQAEDGDDDYYDPIISEMKWAKPEHTSDDLLSGRLTFDDYQKYILHKPVDYDVRPSEYPDIYDTVQDLDGPDVPAGEQATEDYKQFIMDNYHEEDANNNYVTIYNIKNPPVTAESFETKKKMLATPSITTIVENAMDQGRLAANNAYKGLQSVINKLRRQKEGLEKMVSKENYKRSVEQFRSLDL